MIKRIAGKTLAAALTASLALSGCGQAGGAVKEKLEAMKETAAAKADTETKTEAETETEPETAPEETLSPEQMELVKYNYYVDLNNDIVKLLDDIDYYYQVVEYQEDFSLIPDSGHTYGYRISGFNTDIIDDCLELSGLEPAYDTLDPLVKEMADPLRVLMEAFSEISRSRDYAANQYQKPKELHAVVYHNAETVEAMAYKYMDAVNQIANERIAAEEEQMKADGRLIAYNASRAITIAGQIMDECTMQGVTDANINDLDLTKIKPLYEELVAVVNDLNGVCADNDQMIKESMSNSRPFDQLYERMIQALEWMIKQVESGKPIDDPTLEPLGSLAHFSNTLSDCIDRYNTIYAN